MTIYRFYNRMVNPSTLLDLHNRECQSKWKAILRIEQPLTHSSLPSSQIHLCSKICLHTLDLCAVYFYHEELLIHWPFGTAPAKFLAPKTLYSFSDDLKFSDISLLHQQIPLQCTASMRIHHKMLLYTLLHLDVYNKMKVRKRVFMDRELSLCIRFSSHVLRQELCLARTPCYHPKTDSGWK